jgi:hypothetical protein
MHFPSVLFGLIFIEAALFLRETYEAAMAVAVMNLLDKVLPPSITSIAFGFRATSLTRLVGHTCNICVLK